MTRYRCADDERRARLLEQITGTPQIPPVPPASAINGIDFLEVDDDPADPLADRQRTLHVHFLFDVAPLGLTVDNLQLEGGERIRNVQIEAGTFATAGNVVTFEVDEAGDFSPYTLRLVNSAVDITPPPGCDPILSAVTFSFKAGCPSDFDCRDATTCAPVPPPATAPDIDYRARDFNALRTLMLDRLAVLSPAWTERNPADLGVMLVEALAYVGDQLSYRQDAVATEAYLHTARSRISVRRHVRLVDYQLRNGCNARAFVQLQANADGVLVPAATPLLTAITGQPARLDALPAGLDQSDAPAVFLTLMPVTLTQAHDTMGFYTWGGRDCCLRQGATSATLRGAFPGLVRGTFLVLAEAKGPRTGEAEDADPTRRCVVRLTRDARITVDPIGGRFDSPPTGNPVTLTEIEWSVADALPFTLWISGTADAEHLGVAIDDISVAHGNIVPADHGRPVTGELLGDVPGGLLRVGGRTACCTVLDDTLVPPRFRPRLAEAPLTRAITLDLSVPSPPVSGEADTLLSAQAFATATADQAEPVIGLDTVEAVPEPWSPVSDLLASGEDDASFVVESESNGASYLRFGDDTFGRRPAAGTAFVANYRVGNGNSGNVGLAAIRHVVSTDGRLTGAANLLPAAGGIEPETIAEARLRAPVAFRTQERAVTPDDYARLAETHPEVQRAAAAFRWTGSWRTVFLTVDRVGGLPIDDTFEATMRRHLERYRLTGHDLEIETPDFVSLEIAMDVCAGPERAASDVRRELLDIFSARQLPDGRRGLFHPDALTFGQTVFLSRLYSAAQKVAAVRTVSITTFQRQSQPLSSGITSGRLEFARTEIARLDNDPDFPEHGVLTITVGGGR